MSKSALKQIEIRNKRQLSAHTLEYLKQTLAIASSFVRDIACIAIGCDTLVINKDFEGELRNLAVGFDVSRSSVALRELDSAGVLLDYNVSTELVLDVALYKIREAFNGAGSSCKPSI